MKPLRGRIPAQPDLHLRPIEKIRLPLQSRDELPPILAGLQWIGRHPTLQTEIFARLAAGILAGKKVTGRTGMDLGQILVLGVVRRGLDADGDRLEDLANHHLLVRQRLGGPVTPWGADAKVFGQQTLRDNPDSSGLDDELLQPINARLAAAGREVFAKKEGAPLAALAVKADTSVLETDGPFPTDVNLLWDAGRKCVDLIEQYRGQLGCALPAWRKAKEWRRQLKHCARTASHLVSRGGPNKEARVKRAVRDYLAVGRALAAKVNASLLGLGDQPVDAAPWEALEYFHRMLAKPLDLVERRLLQEETIPPHEKVFSLFEPHTEWIQKGQQRPNVELGHRLLIATDQHQLIQDYAVPVGEVDLDQSVPVADRLRGRYGAGRLASLSFDKGFTRTEDRELLSLSVPTVVMPKRGKKNAAETARESEKKFGALRRAHRAVESEIHSLEHPPDASGLPGRGDAGLSAAGGLRGDDLQPARHRAGVAGASASRDGAAGGLQPPHLKPRAKSARRGVAVAGEFQRLGRDRAQNQPCTAHLTPTPPHATCKNGSFRPDTT